MKTGKKGLVFLAGILGIILASIPLLGEDSAVFIKWWVMILAFGVGILPVTSRLFKKFEDKGWLFSKAVGVAVSGFLVWALVCGGILKFQAITCLAVSVGFAVLCFGICGAVSVKRKEKWFPSGWNLDLLLGEELLFLAVFFAWTYLAGFHPEAHGTEKFMDYGFMAAMMRSETLPAPDIWYALKDTNYYYGGQYFAVFLTKLSGSDVANTYNLMRTLVAGLLAGMSFSVVYQMTSECRRIENIKTRKITAAAGGILAGGAVVFAGNLHYVVYGVIGKLLGWQKGLDYWFPNSTRYIGYNPETTDKCIHEFPSYSFVLGDLHAHVVNTMFVVVVIGLMLAWILKVRSQEQKELSWSFKTCFFDPHLILAGFFIGLFQFTNYWDFVIYFTVILICIVYVNLWRGFNAKGKKEHPERNKEKKYRPLTGWGCAAGYLIFQTAEVFLIGLLTALPFTLTFETMVSGVGIAQNHTMFHQWMILWGLPAVLVLVFVVCMILEYKKEMWPAGISSSKKYPGIVDFFCRIGEGDLFAFLLGMCALGLVLIPEVVYVRDIYENGYARSNTMFKLTYQAFIMFGMVMAYVIFRLLAGRGKKVLKVAGGLGLVCLLSTFGYFGNAVVSWFGNVWDPSEYRCLDATRYLENVYPEDAAAIRWLNENVKGNPVVLEANGDSYSDYERVSAMTGLPTVLGWYVHEWLWRGDTQSLNQRAADIETIYTSQDAQQVQILLEQYDVSYIFVGKYEREKYPGLNEGVLQNLGEMVFQEEHESSGLTYVIKVNRGQ